MEPEGPQKAPKRLLRELEGEPIPPQVVPREVQTRPQEVARAAKLREGSQKQGVCRKHEKGIHVHSKRYPTAPTEPPLGSKGQTKVPLEGPSRVPRVSPEGAEVAKLREGS